MKTPMMLRLKRKLIKFLGIIRQRPPKWLSILWMLWGTNKERMVSALTKIKVRRLTTHRGKIVSRRRFSPLLEESHRSNWIKSTLTKFCNSGNLITKSMSGGLPQFQHWQTLQVEQIRLLLWESLLIQFNLIDVFWRNRREIMLTISMLRVLILRIEPYNPGRSHRTQRGMRNLHNLITWKMIGKRFRWFPASMSKMKPSTSGHQDNVWNKKNLSETHQSPITLQIIKMKSWWTCKNTGVST